MSIIHTCSIFCLSLTDQRISILKDGSVSCEYADVTTAVSLPGDVQCELILIPATSFRLRAFAMSCQENTELRTSF